MREYPQHAPENADLFGRETNQQVPPYALLSRAVSDGEVVVCALVYPVMIKT
jgi:hypothetical protein